MAVQDLELALVTKTCPHRPQALKKVKNDQAFPEELFFHFFSERADCSYSKARLRNASRKYSDI